MVCGYYGSRDFLCTEGVTSCPISTYVYFKFLVRIILYLITQKVIS